MNASAERNKSFIFCSATENFFVRTVTTQSDKKNAVWIIAFGVVRLWYKSHKLWLQSLLDSLISHTQIHWHNLRTVYNSIAMRSLSILARTVVINHRLAYCHSTAQHNTMHPQICYSIAFIRITLTHYELVSDARLWFLNCPHLNLSLTHTFDKLRLKRVRVGARVQERPLLTNDC